MSLRINIPDIAKLVGLAWTTLEEARKGCGTQDELTKEIASWHMTFNHLQSELSNPDSIINAARAGRRKDLEMHAEGCRRPLRRIHSELVKFNHRQSGIRPVLKGLQSGNRGLGDISKSRLKLSTYTSAILMTLHLLSLGPQGKSEKELSRQRGETKRLRASINLLIAKQNVVSQEGTARGPFQSNYQDQKVYWTGFRRGLVEEGFKIGVLHGLEGLIKAYVEELGERGVLDDKVFRALPVANVCAAGARAEPDSSDSSSEHEESAMEDFNNRSLDEEYQSEVSRPSSAPRSDETIKIQSQHSVLPRKGIRKHQHPAPPAVPFQAAALKIPAPRPPPPPTKLSSSKQTRTPPRPKARSPLSILLFSLKHRSKRVIPVPQAPQESRKRYQRAAPPPRPVSPSPTPPAWWLEERLRRRPPGCERGRSPPRPPSPPPPSPPLSRCAVDLVYSRSIFAYPEGMSYEKPFFGVA